MFNPNAYKFLFRNQTLSCGCFGNAMGERNFDSPCGACSMVAGMALPDRGYGHWIILHWRNDEEMAGIAGALSCKLDVVSDTFINLTFGLAIHYIPMNASAYC